MINKDELLFVVDENNNPVEPKPRKKVHTKGYWHRNPLPTAIFAERY